MYCQTLVTSRQSFLWCILCLLIVLFPGALTYGQETSISKGRSLMVSNPDSAIYFFKKGKEESQNPLRARSLLRANVFHAMTLQIRKDYSESSRVLFEGVATYKSLSTETDEFIRDLLGSHYYELGSNFVIQGNAQNAISYLEEGKKIFSSLVNDSTYQYKSYAQRNLDKTHKLLGNANTSIRNYEKAKFYYDLHLASLEGTENSAAKGKIFNDTGNLYAVQDKYDEAILLYKNGLRFSQEGLDQNNYALLLNNITYSFLKKEVLDSATHYANLGTTLLSSLGSEADSEWKAYNLMLKGEILSKQQELSSAESSFQRALSIANEEKYKFRADILGTQAEGLIDNGEYQKSIPLLLRAIETLIPEGTLYNDQLYADPFFLEAFSYLIKAEKGLYKEENDPETLKRALFYAQLSNAVEDSLRTSLDYESSKMFLISESHERAEEAIEIALELYKNTQDKVYIEKAFLFSERNHALLLLENINQLEAIAEAQIPEGLRFEENRLRTNLIVARKTLKEKEISKDPELTLYRKIVFDAQEEYNALTQKLKAGSPIYDQLSKTLTISTIQDLQRELSGSDQGIIQYFVGKEHTYGFLITENDIELKRLDLDVPLEEAVLAFRDGIMAAGRDPQLDLQYIQNAQKLYKGLIAPFEGGELTLPKRMVIIPDGILGYVPFDALLTGNPDDNFNYSFFPYLMREYQISYAYSGSLWKKMLKAPEYQRPSEQYLAIAPVFKESEQYAYLQFSEEEVNYISKRLDSGRNLLFQEASKSSFLNILGNRLYKILHFSTHAEMNDEVPMDSHIVMSDNEQDHKLSLADLYAMRLNADMVVLAACETAGGKLQQGEGIISMARGFAYAGCRSLLASLWKVNHFSTSQIMQNYYASLYYGESKDHALQAARIEFLDTYKGINGHPFYWAAFTPIGNMEPVLKHPFWKYIGYLTGGGLVLIFLLFRLRKRFKK